MIAFNSVYKKWYLKLEAIKLPEFTRKEYFQIGFLSIVVLLFSFPGFYPGTETGLDGSYVYGFNYFFAHRIQLGASHIFTYGPLVFIYEPNMVGSNLAIAIPATCALYFYFIYSFLLLGNRVNPSHRLLHILLVIALCNILSFDLIFAAAPILALLNHRFSGKKIWLITVCLFTAVAFLVKSSYGILGFGALFTYALFDLISEKRIRVLLYFVLFVPLFVILLWFIMYRSISCLPGYLYTNIIQVREYSESLQTEDAVNHWGLLGGGIILFFLPLFFIRNKLTRILYLISVIPMYVSFKYSFSREDRWHEAIIWNYMIMVSAIVLLLEYNFRRIALVFQLASVAMVFSNMLLAGVADGYTRNVMGVGNFISWIVQYNASVKSCKAKDSTNLQSKILSKEQRQIIGDASVDCYPFEYSFIPANGLNWDPRPNLQLYISNRWIDSVNAAFLSSPAAPRFYIWQPENPPTDNYYCDNRYLMSEDPLSTYEMFNRYRLINYNGKTALFEHTASNLLSPEKVIGKASAKLEQWLDVPPCDTGSIVRARVHFTDTWKGTLRKILYKDQIYFIDYLLLSGAVKTYRFIPVNAVSGLWMSPLVLDITKGLSGEKVKAVRIRVSRSGCIKNDYRVEWTTFHTLSQLPN